MCANIVARPIASRAARQCLGSWSACMDARDQKEVEREPSESRHTCHSHPSIQRR